MNNFDFPFDVHLFFEQSGTFKDVFSSFGVCAARFIKKHIFKFSGGVCLDE